MRTNTRAIRRRNQHILNTTTICHLCGHPDADAIDHVIPLAHGGTDDPSNLRPAHHTQPCPVCGVKCNRVKGTRLIAPVIRRSGSLNI